MPQLDGLRCFAVLGVLPVHYTTGGITQYVRTGHLGVRLFFVLSGYLITSILLSYRGKVASGQVSLGRALGVFYARRFLRLSPVYYAYLVAAAVFLPGFLQYGPWFALYVQNFLFAIKPHVYSWCLAHFWTLAVEEQFYLFASIAFLTVSSRYLRVLAAGLVALAVAVRIAGLLAGFSVHEITMMMPSHMDTLGMGALMAVLRSEGDRESRADALARIGLIVGGPLTLMFSTMYALGIRPTWLFPFEDLALALLFVWLVRSAAKGFVGVPKRLLEFSPVVFVGRISYGVYVYHFNVPGLLREKLFPRLAIPWPQSELARFTLLTLVTIGIAAVSWYGYERFFGLVKPRLQPRRSHSD
jgi:peptidoglycan/LPS O-acetylase OafA/YrhL